MLIEVAFRNPSAPALVRDAIHRLPAGERAKDEIAIGGKGKAGLVGNRQVSGQI